MASAKEKRKVKGILHDITKSRTADIFTDLMTKLNKTKVDFVNITIKLEAKFRDKDKVKCEDKSAGSIQGDASLRI